MAKTKETKNNIEEVVTNQTGPSYEELLSMVGSLAKEIETLKGAKTAKTSSNDDMTTEILAKLANRKSDQEVQIVHNLELNGGLTTHIELTNASIDFTHIGETRLLNWQQFEECASKYRSFFDRKFILVGEPYAEVAKKYNLPCEGGKAYVNAETIASLPTLSVPELEKLITSLSKEDQDMIFSYWLGKAYKRIEGFYDRYKIDTLNRLSEGSFTNLISVMNGDALNEE